MGGEITAAVQRARKLELPRWWYVAPAYLTVWSLVFSIWNLIDPEGLFDAFDIDTNDASEFVLLNSAARYVAVAVGMVVGIWIFRTFETILTALIVRLSMDLLDLYSGLRVDIIDDAAGVAQAFALFLIPDSFAIATLLWHRTRQTRIAAP